VLHFHFTVFKVIESARHIRRQTGGRNIAVFGVPVMLSGLWRAAGQYDGEEQNDIDFIKH
jgi:hypothetical protein